MKFRLYNYCILALLLCVGTVFGQNPAKGLKYLGEKNYGDAKEIFKNVLIEDANDVIANYGMSRLHGIRAAKMQDSEKALEYLVKAEDSWKQADLKTRAKIAKGGVAEVDLTTRRKHIEGSFLEDAKKDGSIPAMNAFIERFPESGHIRAAVNFRNNLAFEDASRLGSIEALNTFLEKYPEADQKEKVYLVRNKLATEKVLETNTSKAYREFLELYPDVPQAASIEQRLIARAYEEALEANTAEALDAYIQEFPQSMFLQMAKEKLEYIKAGVSSDE